MQTPQNGRILTPGRLKILAIAAAAAAVLVFQGDIVLEVAGIVFGAAVIAFFLTPLCSLLERKLGRSPAALLTLILALGLLLGAIAFLLPLIIRQLMQLAGLIPDALGRIASLAQGVAARLQRQLPGITLPSLNLSALGGNLGEAAKGAVSTLSGLVDGVYRCFLMAVLSYFLITDRERILLRLELLAPLKWRKTAVRSGNVLVRQLRLYLRGQATIALAVGLLAALAMTALGLQGSLVLGLTVGACNVIPYFGPFIGGIPAVLAALSLSWQRALWTVVALFLVQQVDGLLISPRVMGGVTGFSPAVVLLALFAGARIGGVGAMLLALPALMTFRTVYRVFVQLHENN